MHGEGVFLRKEKYFHYRDALGLRFEFLSESHASTRSEKIRRQMTMAAREWCRAITNLILQIVSGAGVWRVYGGRDDYVFQRSSQLNWCVLIEDERVRDMIFCR